MRHSLLLKSALVAFLTAISTPTAGAIQSQRQTDGSESKIAVNPYQARATRVGQNPKTRLLTDDMRPMGTSLKGAIRLVNPGAINETPRAAIPYKVTGTGADHLVAMAIFFDSYDEDYSAGFYNIPLDKMPEGGFELARSSSWAVGTGHAIGSDFGIIGDVYTDGVYFYRTDYKFYNLAEHRFIYNTYADDVTELMTGVYDPSDCKIYAIYYDYLQGKRLFGTMSVKLGSSTSNDPSTIKYTPIGEIDRNYALAAASDGTIYAIGGEASGESPAQLWTIDKTNAKMTKVGALGFNAQYLTTATIDQSTGTLYYLTATTRGCELLTVDTSTGKATKVYDIPNHWEFVGLHTAWREAAPEAPAAPTALEVNFSANALEGTISFTAPTKDFSGETDLEGDLTYTVLLDGEKIARGTTTPGSAVEINATITEPANYTVEVYCTNEAGNGASAKETKWLGWEDPAKITGVTAELDADAHEFFVEWNEPFSATGEDLEWDQLRYKVTLYPTMEVKTTKSLDVTFDLDEYPLQRDFYWAVVTPVYFDKEYPARQTSSKEFVYGEITLPFTETFDRQSFFSDWTVKDYKAYNHAWTWKWQNKMIYIQDNSLPNDDYAFSPRIEMKKGYVYDISIDAAVSSSTPQRLEVVVANATENTGVVATPIPATDIKTYYVSGFEHLTGRFTCDADGYYYVGLHCVNPDAMSWPGMYVDNVTVEAGKSLNAPAAPTDLSVVPDQHGGERVTISYTAPVRTIEGKRLTSIDKVNIERNGEVIATMSPNPGARASYVDMYAEKGLNTYTFVPYADGTSGESASTEIYVGYAAPVDITEIENARTSHNSIHLSWPAVDKDPYGKPYDNVTYEVWSVKGNQVDSKIQTLTSPETDITVGKPTDNQSFARFGIRAVTDGGSTNFIASDFFPFGKPYDAPWKEDFNNGPDYPFLAGGVGNTYGWELVTRDDVDLQGKCDGHFLGWAASTYNDYWNYYTAFIKVPADLKNPIASVDYYCLGELDRNVFSIAVTEDFLNYTVIASTAAGQGLDFWATLVGDLTPYLGKEIGLRIQAYCNNFQYAFIDNITVGSRIDNDIALQTLTATEEVNAGEDIEINVLLENKGANPAKDYKVEISHDGKPIATIDGEEIAPSSFANLTHKVTTTAGWRPEATFTAKLIWDADEIETNNATDDAVVTVIKHNELPAARNLTAVADDNKNVTLTWEEPSIEDMPFETALYNFDDLKEFEEDEDFFETEFCGWKSVDVDQSLMDYGHYFVDPFAEAEIPAGFFAVDDRYYPNVPASYLAHSGHHYMVACRTEETWEDEPDPAKCPNDWLISPELSGDAQEMSFWIIVPEWRGREDFIDFKILISTTGREVEDFTEVVANYEKFSATEWTLMKVKLPQGAKYVAFNYNTTRTAEGMMLDDISVALQGADRKPYPIIGYNVYRNGEKLNDEPLTECTYTDNQPGDDLHRYVVEVVYDCGNGAPSNEANVDLREKEEDGIADVNADKITVTGGNGEIIVSGANGLLINVNGVDGRSLKSLTGSATTVIPARSGIYVVTVARRSFKVAVR